LKKPTTNKEKVKSIWDDMITDKNVNPDAVLEEDLEGDTPQRTIVEPKIGKSNSNI
jgi:hypothetical protein